MGGWGRVSAAENSLGWLHYWAHGLFIQRISAGELRAGLCAEEDWDSSVRPARGVRETSDGSQQVFPGLWKALLVGIR